MRLHVILTSLILIGSVALVVAPGAAACTPSPICVVDGALNTIRWCTSNVVDCTFYVAMLPGNLVNAYLAYAQSVYCQEVGIGC